MFWKNTVLLLSLSKKNSAKHKADKITLHKIVGANKREKMSINAKWNILFIVEDKSMLDSNTQIFNQAFKKVDKVLGTQEALACIDNNHYDIIISDISVDAMEGIIFLKEIKEKKPQQSIFALVSQKDSDKLYLIADLGINAFELSPTDFDLALEEIGKFDPYAQEE